MMVGITIQDYIGIGDKVQFSSLPENYFRSTGKKLIDVSQSWIFDHNPYVERRIKPRGETYELWNFPKIYEWPRPRSSVFLSNAEIWASKFGAQVTLNRPRLYQFEDFAFEKRRMILIHPRGRSHGDMPDHVVEHVIKKYSATGELYQVGLPSDPDYGIKRIETKTLWDLAYLISRARLFIGVDSGPSWIAACYPDVITKKVRLKMPDGEKALKDWVPLEIDSFHSHWDDRLFQIYNSSKEDVGFTQSYKKL